MTPPRQEWALDTRRLGRRVLVYDRRNTGAAVPSDPDFSGWYVQGAWTLTGEPRTYNPAEARFDAPKPN